MTTRCPRELKHRSKTGHLLAWGTLPFKRSRCIKPTNTVQQCQYCQYPSSECTGAQKLWIPNNLTNTTGMRLPHNFISTAKKHIASYHTELSGNIRVSTLWALQSNTFQVMYTELSRNSATFHQHGHVILCSAYNVEIMTWFQPFLTSKRKQSMTTDFATERRWFYGWVSMSAADPLDSR